MLSRFQTRSAWGSRIRLMVCSSFLVSNKDIFLNNGNDELAFFFPCFSENPNNVFCLFPRLTETRHVLNDFLFLIGGTNAQKQNHLRFFFEKEFTYVCFCTRTPCDIQTTRTDIRDPSKASMPSRL